jgi:hypothetical protein
MLKGLAAAAAATDALCSHFDQLAVLVHALIAHVHPAFVTEVGCLLFVGVGASAAS